MILTERLRRPVKSMLADLVRHAGVRDVAAWVCSAIISFRQDSVLPNVVLASICKSRGEFARAGEAYLRVCRSVAQSSKYRSAAIEMFLFAGMPGKAAAVLGELAGSARDEHWFESLERAVRAFCSHGEAKRVGAEIAVREREGAPDITASLRLLLDLFSRQPATAPNGAAVQVAGDSDLDAVVRHATARRYSRLKPGKIGTAGIVDGFTLEPRTLAGFRTIEIPENAGASWRVEHDGSATPAAEDAAERIHVLADAGADLRCLPVALDGAPHRFLVYAQEDQQSREAILLDMEVRSARDLVPDQSPITDVAYAHAERLSAWIMYRLLRRAGNDEITQLLRMHHDALQTALEDRFARAFLGLETVLATARNAGPSGDLLLLAGADSALLHCLPWLYSQADPRRVRLLSPFGRFKARRAFLRSVVGIARAGTRSQYDAGEDAAAESAAGKTDQTLDSWWKKLDADVRKTAAEHCARGRPDANIMVAHLGDRNYGDANWVTAESLARDAPLFIVAASLVLTRKWEEAVARGLPATMDIHSLPQIFVQLTANRPAPRIIEEKFLSIYRDRDWRLFTYRGERAWQLLGRTLHDWFRRDLLRSIVDHLYLSAVCERFRGGVLVLSPGRVRCARMAARIGRELSIPTLDVQMLNTPEYRKYKPPVADVVTVIDDMARDAFERHFDIAADRLRVVGSPKLDMMRDEVNAQDRDAVRKQIGLSDVSGPLVCFASQMQHLDHCLAIVRILADHLRTAPGTLVVKLHPREDDAREQAYAQALRDAPAGRAVVVREMDMTRMLAITDVLVTLYSNAAREALVLGRKVIVCNFTGEPWPLRFDVPGFATGAYSEADLRTALERAGVASSAEGPEAAEEEGSYIARNTHLLHGSATDRIARIVGELRGRARGRT